MTTIQMVVQVMHFLESKECNLTSKQNTELANLIQDIDMLDYEEYKLVVTNGIFLKNLAFGKTHFVSDCDLGLCDDEDYDMTLNISDLLSLVDEEEIFDIIYDLLGTILMLNS